MCRTTQSSHIFYEKFEYLIVEESSLDRCLTQSVYSWSSISQFIKIGRQTIRPLVDFRSSFGVTSVSIGQDKINEIPNPLMLTDLRQTQQTVCRQSESTDRRQTQQTFCRWSDDGRRLFDGLFHDCFNKRNRPSTQKIFLTWPDRHKKLVGRRKKMSIFAKATAGELLTVRPNNLFFGS